MSEETQRSFLGSFFAFNLTTIAGIIIAIILHLYASESHPIWSFLFGPTIYIISSAVAIAIRLVLWIALEKGTMFEAKHVFFKTIRDIIVINLVVLSTLSFLFLITTFL